MKKFADYITLPNEAGIFFLLDTIFARTEVGNAVIQLNQKQLQQGLDAQGKRIRTIKSMGTQVYTLYTIQIKQEKGQPTDRVTLYNTGEFYNTMQLKVVANGYLITANFEKDDGDIRDNISDEYEILGISDEKKDILIWNIIMPALEGVLRKQLSI